MAALSRLPGVGPKTALRYVFYLLKLPKSEIQATARALIVLSERVETCDTCFAYTEGTRCVICQDTRRDPALLCVVEESRDVSTLEATGNFTGRYHVLGGMLNPIEGATPETLRIRELEARLGAEPGVREIILAFSPNVQGETTMMYLSKRLAPLGRRVTRLARGLPIGASLEYADEVTLGDALRDRRETH